MGDGVVLSIIVSSVKKERLEALRANIAETVGDGVDYELLFADNAVDKRPLAAVYNSLAALSRGEYILFIHEDAGFITRGWWKKIERQLMQPDCGVIGFAGGRAMADAPGGWNNASDLAVWHFVERGVERTLNYYPEIEFLPVVAVDGYAFFVRRAVWMENRFDEKLLTGFHCYDVDFSLGIGVKYRNYVCNSVMTYHDSPGNFGQEWLEATGRMYDRKWRELLPVVADGCAVSGHRLAALREQVFFRYIKALKRGGLPFAEWLAEYRGLPMNFRHLRHLLKLPFVRM